MNDHIFCVTDSNFTIIYSSDGKLKNIFNKGEKKISQDVAVKMLRFSNSERDFTINLIPVYKSEFDKTCPICTEQCDFSYHPCKHALHITCIMDNGFENFKRTCSFCRSKPKWLSFLFLTTFSQIEKMIEIMAHANNEIVLPPEWDIEIIVCEKNIQINRVAKKIFIMFMTKTHPNEILIKLSPKGVKINSFKLVQVDDKIPIDELSPLFDRILWDVFESLK